MNNGKLKGGSHRQGCITAGGGTKLRPCVVFGLRTKQDIVGSCGDLQTGSQIAGPLMSMGGGWAGGESGLRESVPGFEL